MVREVRTLVLPELSMEEEVEARDIMLVLRVRGGKDERGVAGWGGVVDEVLG